VRIHRLRLLEVRRVTRNDQGTGGLELALQPLARNQFLDQLARAHQQWRFRAQRVAEILPVAMRGKPEQPAQQSRIETRLDPQRRIRREQPAQRIADRARRCQRRRVARRQRAAVAVRTGAAGRALLKHGHAASRVEQGVRAGEANHAPAKDHDIRSAYGHGRRLYGSDRIACVFDPILR
jgi:hypothetical protein